MPPMRARAFRLLLPILAISLTSRAPIKLSPAGAVEARRSAPRPTI